MAYQTGSAAGASAMIGIINTFAVANGWTSNKNSSTEINVSKGNLYEGLFWDGVSTISAKAATGFDGGAAYNAQPGQSLLTQKVINIPDAIQTYHLFTNATGDYIHCVLGIDANQFRHLCFGLMELHEPGATDGGEYSAAVHHHTFRTVAHQETLKMFTSDATLLDIERSYASTIRLQFDGIVNPWLTVNSTINNYADQTIGCTDFNQATDVGSYSAFYYDWRIFSEHTNAGNVFLSPIEVNIQRGEVFWSPVGEIKDLRCCTLYHYIPSQEVIIDSDTWMVFPMTAKGEGTALSQNMGYAYKKII